MLFYCLNQYIIYYLFLLFSGEGKRTMKNFIYILASVVLAIFSVGCSSKSGGYSWSSDSSTDYGFMGERLGLGDSLDDENVIMDENYYNETLKVRIDHKDYYGAIEDLDYLIQMNPTEPEYYAKRGNVNKILKYYDESLVDLSKAIEMRPMEDRYYAYRAITKSRVGDYQGAVRDLTEAINLNPDEARYYAIRASRKVLLKNYKFAISDYDKAIDLDSKNPNYWYNRGAVKMGLNYRGSALQDFIMAKRLGHPNADNAIAEASKR